MRFIYLPLILLAFVRCSAGPTVEEFRTDVRQRAGDAARDCGYVQLGKDPSTQDQCFAEALSNRVPFFGFRQLQGIDSDLEGAVLGTPERLYYQMRFDSNVCGGASRGPGCGSKVFVDSCTPVIGEDASNGIFNCALPED